MPDFGHLSAIFSSFSADRKYRKNILVLKYIFSISCKWPKVRPENDQNLAYSRKKIVPEEMVKIDQDSWPKNKIEKLSKKYYPTPILENLGLKCAKSAREECQENLKI